MTKYFESFDNLVSFLDLDNDEIEKLDAEIYSNGETTINNYYVSQISIDDSNYKEGMNYMIKKLKF